MTPAEGTAESLSENRTIFLWGGTEHPYTSSAQDLSWLNTARQSLSWRAPRSLMLHYLRYRNGCVFLGKYAAYTVSMAFLKAADSTSRSEKQKKQVPSSKLSFRTRSQVLTYMVMKSPWEEHLGNDSLIRCPGTITPLSVTTLTISLHV